MEFIENLVNSSTFYYFLIGIVYVLCIIVVVMLLVKRKKKRYIETKPEIKKDLESVDLEAVLGKMQEEVSKPKDEIMTFEEEQEEKAIISYQELLNAVKKNVKEVTSPTEVRKDETLESIIEELEENKEEVKEEQTAVLEPIVLQNESDIKVIEKEEVKPSKFQNSEFISPIFGRVNNELEYPKIKSFDEPKEEKDLEKTIVMPKIESNIDSNDEFLRILKEFRNNLE